MQESNALPDPIPADAGDAKLQRWVDLVAALLARRHEVTFDELAPDVPGYEWPDLRGVTDPAQLADGHRRRQSTKRTFERDKDQLRALGIPIDSVPDADGNREGAYRLRKTDFYLPYLVLVAPGRGDVRLTQPPAGSAAERSKLAAGYGYAALATLAFEPDELQAIVDAAALARDLGDPMLTLEATRALRKLALDLPVGLTDDPAAGDTVAAGADVPLLHRDAGQHDAATFQALADAVQRRKRVSFEYHTFGRDDTRTRSVEPWGLFFLTGHWYLAARDLDADALRNFRLSRIRQPRVNADRAQSADFTIPATFRLREHAVSRQAWELGDEAPLDVVVRFTGHDGATRAAMALGTPVSGAPGIERRQFAVRRVEPFGRWLLSFAGDAIPEAPAVIDGLREALGRLAASIDTAEARAAALGDAVIAAATPVPRPTPRPRRMTDTAAAQLRRLLQTLPLLATGDEYPIHDLVARTGSDVATLRRDLFALVARYDLPGGFVEGVQLFIEDDRISAISSHFRRPMRLVATELCAITLGLGVLRHLRPPDEHVVLERARARLDRIIAQIGDDPLPEPFAAALGDGGDLATLATLRAALQDREVVRLAYHKSGAVDAEPREVEPYAIVASGARFYVIAHCRRAGELRLFRLDRVRGAERTGERYAMPDGFSMDAVLERGRAFMQGAHDLLVVRYAPRIARWIAEREGVALADDGSLTLAHPLADREWAVRHVFQYAGDAEVLAPAAVRNAMRERVAALRERLA